MYDRESAPTEEQVRKFEYLSPMINSALSEMRDFAKKKQDGIVSETKIKILNRLLKDIRKILAAEESVGYLDPLDEEQLPQNSDAVLILGQYRAALDSFKNRHHKTVDYNPTWITKEWIDAQKKDYDEEYEDDDEDEEK